MNERIQRARQGLAAICLRHHVRCFGLIEDLTALFDRPIHLFVARAVRNPYILRSINQTRESLFAGGEVRDTSELAQVIQFGAKS
jgi:hypothetical protein